MVKYTKRRKTGGRVKCFNKYGSSADFDGIRCSPNYPFKAADATGRPTCDNTAFTLIKMCESKDESIQKQQVNGKCEDGFTEIIQCSREKSVPTRNPTMGNTSYDEYVSALNSPSSSASSSPRSSFASVSSQGGKRRRTRKNNRRGRKTRKHSRRK